MGLTEPEERRQKAANNLANAKARNKGRNRVCKSGDWAAWILLVPACVLIAAFMASVSNGGFAP